MKKIILLIALVLTALAGCSVPERPVIDRNSPEYQMVLKMLFAARKEMAAEVEYKKYLRELERLE